MGRHGERARDAVKAVEEEEPELLQHTCQGDHTADTIASHFFPSHCNRAITEPQPPAPVN